MIAKRAQQRILFKTSPKWLSIKSANTPSQTRVPSTTITATTTTTAACMCVPRDEQRAIIIHQNTIKIEKIQSTSHKAGVRGRKSRGMGGDDDALFVIGEEWLDRSRMGRQRAVESIESMKGMFGTACR